MYVIVNYTKMTQIMPVSYLHNLMGKDLNKILDCFLEKFERDNKNRY